MEPQDVAILFDRIANNDVGNPEIVFYVQLDTDIFVAFDIVSNAVEVRSRVHVSCSECLS